MHFHFLFVILTCAHPMLTDKVYPCLREKVCAT